MKQTKLMFFQIPSFRGSWNEVQFYYLKLLFVEVVIYPVVIATNLCGWRLICSCFPLCSTPDPDNVLIVKTPEGVFSTKFFLQDGEKQTAARLVRKENHQEKVLPVPAKVSDCLSARCQTYEILKYKVVFLHLFIVLN
jgi:hypothetical protein